MQLLLWLLAYVVSCYLLVVTRLSFLEPSVLALKTRLALRPHVRDWVIHILSKSGPDLLLSSIIILRWEDSKAIGKTHGTVFSTLLLLPGLSRLLLPSASPRRRGGLSLRLRVSLLGLLLCSLVLASFLVQGPVGLSQSAWLLALFAGFQTLGICISLARPDPAETELLVLQQTRALGAMGVLLLPSVAVAEPGNFDQKLPGHQLLSRLMFAASVGSPLEPLAPAAVVVAFFWVFVFSLGLDEATTKISDHLGVSDQLVGLTLVALATKLPKLISAYLQRHVICVSADSLDRLTFSTSAALALPWGLRALLWGEGGSQPPRALSVVGCGLSLAAVAAAVATRDAVGVRAGAALCLAWLATQVVYVTEQLEVFS